MAIEKNIKGKKDTAHHEGFASTVRRLAATKLSKDEAGYGIVGHPPEEICRTCRLRVSETECLRLYGKINPDNGCWEWEG